jgi:hypothetical protein
MAWCSLWGNELNQISPCHANKKRYNDRYRVIVDITLHPTPDGRNRPAGPGIAVIFKSKLFENKIAADSRWAVLTKE